MKKIILDKEQFAFQTKYLENDNLAYLNSIAPLIGYIVIDFNSLEERVTSIICDVISDRADDQGLLITYKMSYSEKVELLMRYSNWIQTICERKIESHDQMFKYLKECGRLRNLTVHAEWDKADLEGFTFVKYRIDKNGIRQEYLQFDEASLEKINNLIIVAYNFTETFFNEFTNLKNS